MTTLISFVNLQTQNNNFRGIMAVSAHALILSVIFSQKKYRVKPCRNSNDFHYKRASCSQSLSLRRSENIEENKTPVGNILLSENRENS